MTDVHWDSQKSVFISYDNYVEVLGLNLFTSVICKVEYILFYSMYTFKKDS